MPYIPSPCKECTDRILTDKGGKACGEHNCEKFKAYRAQYHEQSYARNKHARTQFEIRNVQYNGLSKIRRKK